MSDKNLLIGDTNYPHTSDMTLTEMLRSGTYSMITLAAADRIEQLERELAAEKIGHARYQHVRNMPKESFIDIKGNCEAFDKAIDAAINGVKA